MAKVATSCATGVRGTSVAMCPISAQLGTLRQRFRQLERLGKLELIKAVKAKNLAYKSVGKARLIKGDRNPLVVLKEA